VLCVLLDAIARYIPGVLVKKAVTDEESFSDGLLEYPSVHSSCCLQRGRRYRRCFCPVIMWLSKDGGGKKALQATLNVRPDVLTKAAAYLEGCRATQVKFSRKTR